MPVGDKIYKIFVARHLHYGNFLRMRVTKRGDLRKYLPHKGLRFAGWARPDVKPYSLSTYVFVWFVTAIPAAYVTARIIKPNNAVPMYLAPTMYTFAGHLITPWKYPQNKKSLYCNNTQCYNSQHNHAHSSSCSRCTTTLQSPAYHLSTCPFTL